MTSHTGIVEGFYLPEDNAVAGRWASTIQSSGSGCFGIWLDGGWTPMSTTRRCTANGTPLTPQP